MLTGETLMAGAPPPVPDSATVGLPALLETVAVADLAPRADGLNVTWNVQLEPGAMFAPLQPSADFGKSPELVPPIVTPVTVNVAVPVLDTVTVCAALDAPTTIVP